MASIVNIVIVNYNGWKDSIECVKSLMKQTDHLFRIFIVDNASADDSYQQIKQFLSTQKWLSAAFEDMQPETPPTIDDKAVILIHSRLNKGFAAGNNIALRWMDCLKMDYDYIWFLNNDTVTDRHTLSLLRHFMEHAPANVGIAGGKLRYYFKPDTIQAVGGLYNPFTATSRHIGNQEVDIGQYDTTSLKFDYVVGASMFVRKEFIRDVGFMSEDYFLYFEETDWIARGRKRGWTIGYEPHAIIYHKEGGTTMRNKAANQTSDYYYVRNKLIFTYKNYPALLITVFPITLGSIILRFKRHGYLWALSSGKSVSRAVYDILCGKIKRQQI